jgi:hypothetical protein
MAYQSSLDEKRPHVLFPAQMAGVVTALHLSMRGRRFVAHRPKLVALIVGYMESISESDLWPYADNTVPIDHLPLVVHAYTWAVVHVPEQSDRYGVFKLAREHTWFVAQSLDMSRDFSFRRDWFCDECKRWRHGKDLHYVSCCAGGCSGGSTIYCKPCYDYSPALDDTPIGHSHDERGDENCRQKPGTNLLIVGSTENIVRSVARSYGTRKAPKKLTGSGDGTF